MSQITKTLEGAGLRPIQQENLDILRKSFGLSDAELSRCLFFKNGDDEPWIPADILQAIARKHGGFAMCSSVHDKVVPETRQIVYAGLVTDPDGRSYPRSGVASLDGETIGDRSFDGDTLAEQRALSAALTAAGFNPFKAGSVVSVEKKSDPVPAFSGQPLTDEEKQIHDIADAAALRNKDLRQIHTLAEQKGLIVYLPSGSRMMQRYRDWLHANFSVHSAAVLDPDARARVVDKLLKYSEPDEFIQHLPADLREDALIA